MVTERQVRSLFYGSLALLPLGLMGLLLLANGRYMQPLIGWQPPYVLFLPCGWVALLAVGGLAVLVWVCLQRGDRQTAVVWAWLWRLAAVGCVFIGLVLVTMTPAVLQIMMAGSP